MQQAHQHWANRLALILWMSLSFSSAYADTQSRASAFEYDAVTGLLTKEIIEPDDPNLCLVTTYTYDTFGNKTDATTRNCNGSAGTHPGVNSEAAAPASNSLAKITTRTSSTIYDARGQLPVSTTNALNQTFTYGSDSGNIASITTPNGISTNFTYDEFDNPITETHVDGANKSDSYDICEDSCPIVGGAEAKYTITSTETGATYIKAYYDMLGRKIQTETQDVNGDIILVQVKYDKQGRAYQTSQPFKFGTTALWTTVEFDKLDRLVKVITPDGKITTTAYNGYTTTTTNAKGQTKTEVKNSQGQLVTVTDAQGKSLSNQYDPFGNLVKTTDALNNVTIMAYDKRGRKIAMDDPDQGVWTYEYDTLGQLKQQTDAKFQTVIFAYDKLGRITQRNESDLISTWSYDTCDTTLNPAGKCIGKPVKETSSTNYTRTYLYDSLGRAAGEVDNVDQGYGVVKSFDIFGRVETLNYPSPNNSNFQIRYVYSNSGYLSEIVRVSDQFVIWKAGATDSAGRLIQEIYGNGVVNTTNYDYSTGRVSQINVGGGSGWDGTVGSPHPVAASGSNSILSQSFAYDSIGNIVQRYDAVTNLNEGFGYDSLNRLISTSAQAGAGPLTQATITYNAIGNILSKSDVGTYTYNSQKQNGQIRPHAVSKIMMNDGITLYASYAYDANGNVLSTLDSAGKGRNIVWNSWNMPNQITGNKPATSNMTLLSSTPINTTSSSFQFVYNASHERVKEILPDGTIIYNISPRIDTGIHTEKRVKPNGSIEYSYSLYAGTMPFGIQNISISNSGQWSGRVSYYHNDHLGSVMAVTDEAGNVVERRSFDAWGKRRNINGTPANSAFVTSGVRHAYTGHEDLGEVGLIHMNGRLYDSATARFISADPTVQYEDNLQNFNRYSYINNNPLSATDPSGYSLSCSDCGVVSYDWDLGGNGNYVTDYTFGSLSSWLFIPKPTKVYHPTYLKEKWEEESGTFFDTVVDLHLEVEFTKHLLKFDIKNPKKAPRNAILKTFEKAYKGVPQNYKIGKSAENILIKKLGKNVSGNYFMYTKNGLGGRFLDVYDYKRNIGYESKVGYTRLSDFVRKQVLKDAQLIKENRLEKVVWNFFRSPITGLQGPSPELKKLLDDLNIGIKFYNDKIKIPK